ncbi:uncharacterized protein LOC116137892 isoform X4 [Pistacia vera]|uniref:uncharacterized protein LOC116137892 isoform X3 n=1 Tax=Pistacia vera TaxID=55513 RepID=UPI001262F472|nr:uncharacterized protein LOC116137892 isoform X3 [Pistacia vera]XP_031279451.1 uncharacterized protein LOC116137892 isoform X4 [Pistacia vera]
MCETMSSSTETSNGDQAVVELIVCDASPSSVDAEVTASEEITPLLIQSEKPKINIFSVSYSRRKPREQVIETETLPLTRFLLWVWNGSRYSGLICMAVSSTIYFFMELISDIFTVQSIPLFETAFTRCTIIMILSYLWLRRSGQPIFGPTNARNLLISRALTGYLSLFSFVFCIQSLPLSQAVVLNFTTPVMASIMARIVLRENLKISDIGGLACSFFGVLFIFQHMFTTQGELVKNGKASNSNVRESHHIYAILVGLISSITGGINFCLIKAGAKASDQPVVTLFSFGVLASPAAAICAFVFEKLVLPSLYSILLMLVLGVLAFLAEVFLARGLLLEKTSKVVNVQYIEVALTQLWGIGSFKIAPLFGRLLGCFLISLSVCYTMFIGPDKEMNDMA